MAPAPSHLPVELQDRDLALLKGLFESRVMTLAHAAALYFGGRAEAAKKRLQKLKAAGLIRERPRKAYEPSVLFLTSKAFTVLSGRGQLADYPRIGLAHLERRAQVSDLTLRHELRVMDCKAAVVPAVASLPRFEVIEFSTWPLLSQFRASVPDASGYGRTEVGVKPDGLIRVHERDADGVYEHAFFLEVDRSTEVQGTLALKAAGYGDYYRSGGYAIRQGGTREEYADYPFRVLVVLLTAERRNNTAERLLLNRPPVHTQVWLTTFNELIADPLGPIWVRPVDYRDVVNGTPFEPGKQVNHGVYRRRPEREDLVERLVPKHPLLDGMTPTDTTINGAPTESEGHTLQR